MREVHAKEAQTRLGIAIIVAAGLTASASPSEAACQKGEVFVKPGTAVRRGPGLNFAPSVIIDAGDCFSAEEVSADQAWVLIKGEGGSPYGWVAVGTLDAEGRASLGTPAKKGAVGSQTQLRGFVVMRGRGTLIALPDSRARVKKALQPGARLLALACTPDGTWLEVRDERGETGWVVARSVIDDANVVSGLAKKSPEIPESELEGSAEAPKEEQEDDDSGKRKPKKKAARRVEPKDEETPTTVAIIESDSAIEAEVLGLAAFPQRGFSSNGADGKRRYSLKALASGLHLQALARGLGPIRARIAYDILLLANLRSGQAQQGALSAQGHDARILAGYPIAVDALLLIPEIGYALTIFSMDPNLPGEQEARFISSVSHGGHLGVAGEYSLSEDLRFDAEGALVVGSTKAYGLDIGQSKLSVTLRAGAALRYALGVGGLSLVGRWDIAWRRAPFVGVSKNDPTITQATLTNIDNAFGAGISIEL